MLYELDERSELLEIIVSQHKDVYGFKPRGASYERLAAMTYEQLRAEADELNVLVAESIEQDKMRENAAVTVFKSRVADLIETGAADEATAIRWIMSAEDADTTEELEYSLGLPYGYLNKK